MTPEEAAAPRQPRRPAGVVAHLAVKGDTIGREGRRVGEGEEGTVADDPHRPQCPRIHAVVTSVRRVLQKMTMCPDVGEGGIADVERTVGDMKTITMKTGLLFAFILASAFTGVPLLDHFTCNSRLLGTDI